MTEKSCRGKHPPHDAATPTVTCTRCGRLLCFWHFADQPVDSNGKVRLAPVCHPKCESRYWPPVAS